MINMDLINWHKNTSRVDWKTFTGEVHVSEFEITFKLKDGGKKLLLRIPKSAIYDLLKFEDGVTTI